VIDLGSASLIWRITRDHAEAVLSALAERFPPPVALAARTAVGKLLRCGTADGGFCRFRCMSCAASHTVFLRCNSRFCPRCGLAQAAKAAADAQSRLLNVEHQHMTFSVPSELRRLLFLDRSLLRTVAKAASMTTIHAMGTRCRAHAPLPGVMATVHTYGRSLDWHVHVHVLVTRGGLRADGVWQPIKLFPAAQYRKLWQYHLLKLLRQRLKSNKSAVHLIGYLHHKYKTGFIVNVMSHYRNGRKAAAYCCRYTGRPPLSEKRIVAYDGQIVALAYNDYRDGQDKTLELPAVEFLLQLLQHVQPRYQRSVFYFGLYQPARRRKNVDAVVKASRYADQVRPVPLSSKERLQIALSQLRTSCPECGSTEYYTEEIRLPERAYVQRLQAHKAKPKTRQLSLRV
jgi:predicted nucleic-acid-binding Zn-ribbon protein